LLERLFRSATEAVAPETLIERHLARNGADAILHVPGEPTVRLPLPLLVAGVGKASARMALGCERVLGPETTRGMVITADGRGAPLGSPECRVAGHPLPDQRALDATRRLIERVERERGPILFLLSGGASSLLVLPRPPVSLADKIAASSLLLACGAE